MIKSILAWISDSALEQQLKMLCIGAPSHHQFIWAETMTEVCNYVQIKHIDLLILQAQEPYSDIGIFIHNFRMFCTAPVFAFLNNDDLHTLSFAFGLVEDGMILPFDSDKEFIVRCMSLINSNAVLQKRKNTTIERISKRGVTIDASARLVIIEGKSVDGLTRIEFDLLLYLMLNIDIVLSRQQIYENVWKNTFAYDIDNTVKCHIKTLRKKISRYTAEEIIETVIGVGYKISSKTHEQLSFNKVAFA